MPILRQHHTGTDGRPVSDVEALRDAVQRLEAAYERRRAELDASIADIGKDRGLTPEDMRDPNGRSILLDALTALVTARTALALAEVLR
jgi:hypothetical protein